MSCECFIATPQLHADDLDVVSSLLIFRIFDREELLCMPLTALPKSTVIASSLSSSVSSSLLTSKTPMPPPPSLTLASPFSSSNSARSKLNGKGGFSLNAFCSERLKEIAEKAG
ncbi:unnamed protein product [Gongylonema pulchrum]|uniref:Uncharacterized protein n=1 Tax=Gongylonema pulchrum TaxID=637853 RepID=A0A183DNN1_9BILA|nr:unnamed protein product [Gongylonema pulchrum]